jgi:hypothetical protein
MTFFPHQSYFPLFLRLKIKLNGSHFDTIEVIEAESQAVLNSLTEHDFQDAFKNGRSAGNGAYALKETISRVMAATVPEIMDGSLYSVVRYQGSYSFQTIGSQMAKRFFSLRAGSSLPSSGRFMVLISVRG